MVCENWHGPCRLPWHPAGWSGGCKREFKIMALRFENAARYLVSLAGAAAFTVVMIANTVSLGPVA